jgi:hypothetical protein
MGVSLGDDVIVEDFHTWLRGWMEISHTGIPHVTTATNVTC